MALNYSEISERYRPEKIGKKIHTLLVGEAPPPNGKSYFYIPRSMSNNNTSLPATIFYHYFKRRPETKEKYTELLCELQKMGIFFIDICDEPIKIRDNKHEHGINTRNLKRLIAYIPNLRKKMKKRNINAKDSDIIFLLPRQHYKKYLKQEFPSSEYIRWIDFRMSPELCSHDKNSLRHNKPLRRMYR